MNEAEEQFMAANGMSSDQAWQYILRWKAEGKNDQVRRGCEEILKVFPDHADARNMHASVESIPEDADSPAGASGEQLTMPVDGPPKPPGLLGKIRATLNQQRQKLKEMNPPQKRAATPPGMATQSHSVAVSESERLLGAACYLWIFVIIPMLLRRDSEFVQFHAWQGIVITAGVIILNVIISIVTSPFQIVSGNESTSFFLVLDFGFRILAIAIYVWGAYSAYSGKWSRLPIVYPIAEKLHRATKA